ncbi:hypothetical protein [Bacillus tuaregi]|uniref:hypothetical protein n=1 Tax=Bacillus tuaregi TaxID=1816695 RepID=UPI0008F8E8E0|nr:hypothetical protein [Bacillus tuaregi]
MNYLLEINKRPYRNEDHLAFMIYKLEQQDMGGFLSNYKIIKHFERLGPLERNKEGNFVKLIDLNENEYKIYFGFDVDLTNQIINWADSINKIGIPYEHQLEEFITLITNSEKFKRLS